MPADPASMSGLRPMRSTNAIAMKVVATFVTLMMTVIKSELCCEKPTLVQGTLEY
jgi:hypothetical protein